MRVLTIISISVVAFVLSVAPAKAQETSSLKLPAVVFIAAQGLDLHTTYVGRSRNAIEGNPLMDVSTGQQIAIKAATTTVAIWATSKLHKRHPRATKTVLYLISGTLAGVAAHNYAVARR